MASLLAWTSILMMREPPRRSSHSFNISIRSTLDMMSTGEPFKHPRRPPSLLFQLFPMTSSLQRHLLQLGLAIMAYISGSLSPIPLMLALLLLLMINQATHTLDPVLDYSGMPAKDTQIILSACGGHSDYSGNEVTAIELAEDIPSWRLLHAATPVALRLPNQAYMADGLPASRHAYNNAHFSTTRNRWVLHYTRFVWPSAYSYRSSNGFNLDNNTWDPAGTFSDGYTGSCRDISDNVWAAGGYFYLYKWTAATDTWEVRGSFQNETSETMAYDSKRDQIFQFSYGDSQGDGNTVWANIYTQDGTVQTAITFNNSAAYQQYLVDQPAYVSLQYDAIGDQFLLFAATSGNLYQIKPNDGLVWDINIIATTGTIPAPMGAFNRMVYMPQLRGYVYMPNGDLSLYFLRLY